MKKRVLTGVKPTGLPHLGNFLGAIQPALELTKSTQYSEALFFIADYHSLTSIHRGEDLSQLSYEVAATWLACGLDPKRAILYKQSDIPEVFELHWILSCFAPKGFMNRAHAYKARLQENEQEGRKDPDFGVNMGLYTYPLLMSADMLLFSADVVPVGEDQVQHLEIARDIALKVNNEYGPIFKLPEPLIQSQNQLVLGLDGRKMSKSYNNTIPLFLERDALRKKIMKIKTDSLPPETPKDPDQSLIFALYKSFALPAETDQLRLRYVEGISWGEAKEVLFLKLDEALSEPRRIYNEWIGDRGRIDSVLKQGQEAARDLAAPIMKNLRHAVGVHRS